MTSIAKQLDEKAVILAKRWLSTEAEILSVLMEMRKYKVFPLLNYSGVFDYCERRLHLSRAQSYYFLKVTEKSEEIPEIKQAIMQGELNLSQARRIAPVITQETKQQWIEKAKTLPQAELERQVTAANPKAYTKERIRPVAESLSELKVLVDNKTEENLSILKNILSQKMKRAATLQEVIAWISEVSREKFDPERKATRAKKQFLGNEMPRAGRHPIPDSVKHAVIRRMGFQCCHKSPDGRRCVEKRWLHFHHMKPVAQGGLNHQDNLILLCSNHHSFMHHFSNFRENPLRS